MWKADELFQLEDGSCSRLFDLPGRCAGSVLKGWATPVQARFGSTSVEHVRSKLAKMNVILPDSFVSDEWYPAWMQIVLTQAVRALFFAHDATAFCRMLVTAGQESASAWVAKMLRLVKPGVILRYAGRIHPTFYDVGHVSSEVVGTTADIWCQGAELFENPTWRALQLVGQQGFIELTGAKPVSAIGFDAGAGAFHMNIRWN